MLSKALRLLRFSILRWRGMFLPFYPCELKNLLSTSWAALLSVSRALTLTRGERVARTEISLLLFLLYERSIRTGSEPEAAGGLDPHRPEESWSLGRRMHYLGGF